MTDLFRVKLWVPGALSSAIARHPQNVYDVLSKTGEEAALLAKVVGGEGYEVAHVGPGTGWRPRIIIDERALKTAPRINGLIVV